MEHSLATELTRQLIQIESTDPGTYELTIKDWICSWLISALHADVRLYQDEVLPNRFNLMATSDIGSGSSGSCLDLPYRYGRCRKRLDCSAFFCFGT